MMKLVTTALAPTVIVLAIGMAATPVVGAQATLATSATGALRAAKNEVFMRVAGAEREIHGQVIERTADSLTLGVDGRRYLIPMASVLRIDTIGGANRHKLVRGALIGGLATGALCALVCGQGVDSASEYSIVVLGNGGVGAAIGGLIGFTREGRKTIYKSAGTGAAISRRPSELPCPATPLVLEADLSPIDLRRLTKTWTPVPQSQGFGASRCDGVTIQRRYDTKTGVWQPGVEIAAGLVDAAWLDVRVRVTVRNPKDGRDKKAHIDIGLRQDARSQVTSILSIAANADEENSGDVVLRVPRALLSSSSSGLSLQVTLTTSYPR